MRTPTIHLNGTGKDSLIEEASNALTALAKAREEVCKMTVHGRDFYPQNAQHDPLHGGPYKDARKQFNAMLARLDSIRTEITDYAHAILDGGAKTNQSLTPAERVAIAKERGSYGI